VLSREYVSGGKKALQLEAHLTWYRISF